jgi:peptidyl-prolyl cis-trans isomerase C
LSRSVRLALALCVSLPAGCRQKDAAPAVPDPNQVVATWVGGKFTRSEVESLVAQRMSRPTVAAASPERRAALVETLLGRRVRWQLLYREAVAAGILERPPVKAVLRAIEERGLAEDWLARHASRGAQADPAQVERETQTLAEQSTGQELRRFSHVFLRAPQSDAEARARARARAAEIRREIVEGAAFDEVARKYSDSITARGGGQVEWTPRGSLHDVVAETVFTMSEGQMSEPVETEMGVHIFRLDAIRRPAPPDVVKIREEVKTRLDQEAAAAAATAEMDRTFDASGVRLDAKALSRPGRPDQVVAVVGGETLRRQEVDWVRDILHLEDRPAVEVARWLVVNRILAAKRRAEPGDPELDKKIDQMRFSTVVDIRRGEVMAAIPKDVSAAEVAEYYEKHRHTPLLSDHILDVLFFPQKGPTAAEVYAKGEVVSKKLRDGSTFDKILEEHAREPGVVVRRGVTAGDVQTIRSRSLVLSRVMPQLEPGEVSAPIYFDNDTLNSRDKTVVSGHGLLFVRLVEVRPQPLEAVRGRIREALQRQKQNEATAAMRKRLDEQGGLKMMVANP